MSLQVWMVYWSKGPDFQFKLFWNEQLAIKHINDYKVKKTDNHKMMQVEIHGLPELYVLSHDDDNFRHVVFLERDQGEKWLQANDSGHMDIHKAYPGDTV